MLRLLYGGGSFLRPTSAKGCRRGLALKAWSRPAMAELLVPREQWNRVYKRNQRKFNVQLAIGVTLFGITCYKVYTSVVYNGTPNFLKKTRIHTTLPPPCSVVPLEVIARAVGVSDHYVDLAGLSDAPVAVKVVEEVLEDAKEVLDIVDECIVTGDTIVKDIKEIEDKTKEIIDDSSKLAKDIKEVIAEGVEIGQELKDAAEAVVKDVEKALEKNNSAKLEDENA